MQPLKVAKGNEQNSPRGPMKGSAVHTSCTPVKLVLEFLHLELQGNQFVLF